MKFNIGENLQKHASHRHWCAVDGHDYECAEDCECICGLAMNGNDHSGCPVELRECPEHKVEQERRLAEAMPSEGSVHEIAFDEPQKAILHCRCGCSEVDAAEVVGWCLWCNHLYTKWSTLIQDRHFAHHCPGAPAQSRQNAHASLAKRQMRS
jgi:hypothetical protein